MPTSGNGSFHFLSFPINLRREKELPIAGRAVPQMCPPESRALSSSWLHSIFCKHLPRVWWSLCITCIYSPTSCVSREQLRCCPGHVSLAVITGLLVSSPCCLSLPPLVAPHRPPLSLLWGSHAHPPLPMVLTAGFRRGQVPWPSVSVTFITIIITVFVSFNIITITTPSISWIPTQNQSLLSTLIIHVILITLLITISYYLILITV